MMLLPAPSWIVAPSLSAMIDDALARRMVASKNPDDRRRLSVNDERDTLPFETASSSCRILPADSTVTGIPLTSPSAASVETSTAGFALAERGVSVPLVFPLDMPAAVSSEDEVPESTDAFWRKTSRIAARAAVSRGCSLRLITAEYVSGSCQPVSSRSGSGWWGVDPDTNRLNDSGARNIEGRDTVAVSVGAAAGAGAVFVAVDMFDSSLW